MPARILVIGLSRLPFPLWDSSAGSVAPQSAARSGVCHPVKVARTRLEHVRANVADLTSAVEWYTEVLGFEVEAFWPPDRPKGAEVNN